MSEWKKYRRTNVAEMRPYVEGEERMKGGDWSRNLISISEADRDNGSPKVGDMIARNPVNHYDQWLVAKDYFEKNFEETK